MKNPANDGQVALALRQVQEVARGAAFWIVVGAAVLIAAIAGPYYTLERLSFPERLVYWGVVIALSSVIMTFLSVLAFRITAARGWNWALVAGLAGAVGVLPVLGKLPHHLGREIVALRAQDHYLEVTTPKGRCMVLMRLGDAVRDLEGLNGMQVHRSWWINLAHIARVARARTGQTLC